MTSSISIIAPTYSALTKEECKIDSYATSFNHYVTIYPPDMSLADALGNVDDFYFIHQFVHCLQPTDQFCNNFQGILAIS